MDTEDYEPPNFHALGELTVLMRYRNESLPSLYELEEEIEEASYRIERNHRDILRARRESNKGGVSSV